MVLSYREALNQAMREEMRRDPRIFLIGEDVGYYQGAFKVSKGFVEEFGPQRVVDTPITEAGFTGLAIGAAMAGLHPIVELMTMNFGILALDQIVNNAAKIHYMSGGQLSVPLVIRGPGSAAHQLGAQHSQSLEAWFCHVPGLKVIAPATPHDAKGLLKSAIRDNNPIIFIEAQLLYGTKGDVGDGEYTIPIGVAEVKRAGRDATIVAYSKMHLLALEAADQLSREGIEAEVIDPRTLKPLDLTTIVTSVKKTGRLVIGVAPDRDQAIALGEAVQARLAPLVSTGELGGVRSLHTFLWPESRQRENLAALRADAELPARLRAAYQAAGFRADAFTGFERALAQEPPPPLRFEDLAGSPLADLVRPLLADFGDEFAVNTYLQGLKSPEAVRRAIEGLPGVHFFDQGRFLNEVYAEFRATTVRQIFTGNLLVIGLLLLRYRRLRPAVAAFLPSLLVTSILLGSFAALGVETNLLHVVGLVMVLGMGVDYGVFVVDSASDPEEMGTTLLSIFLGSITTVFTFGVLALSQHPALRALGVTIGAGILLAFLLAPLSLLVLRERPGAELG